MVYWCREEIIVFIQDRKEVIAESIGSFKRRLDKFMDGNNRLK